MFIKSNEFDLLDFFGNEPICIGDYEVTRIWHISERDKEIDEDSTDYLEQFHEIQQLLADYKQVL